MLIQANRMATVTNNYTSHSIALHNLEVDRVEKQKTTLGYTPCQAENKTETTVGSGWSSTKMDSLRLEKRHLVWWMFCVNIINPWTRLLGVKSSGWLCIDMPSTYCINANQASLKYHSLWMLLLIMCITSWPQVISHLIRSAQCATVISTSCIICTCNRLKRTALSRQKVMLKHLYSHHR